MKVGQKLMELLNSFLRVGSVLLVLLLEISLLGFVVYTLQRSAVYAYIVMQLFSVPLIYVLVEKEARYKLSWVLIIFLLPGAGFLLYFLWGSKREFSWFNRRFRQAEREVGEQLPIRAETEARAAAAFPNEAPLGGYMARSGYPVYECADSRFFPSGADLYPSMMEDLRSAAHFIHIEMFILDRGTIWDEVFAILKEKVRQGVQVCLLLDDFGSLKASTPDFRRKVRAAGIDLAFFAPINKDVLHVSFNFRTHQKLILVDGKVGYCGGINLADEYFDRKRRFGYWKDSAVRITGGAVRSMDAIFSVMWQVSTGRSLPLPPPTAERAAPCGAFVRPFAGGPAKNPDNPVQVLYDLVIHRAVRTLYITTPYLVLDRQMAESLVRAARSGVDVRIYMPGIYDKSYVHAVSRHNFGALLRGGVRVFEYTPGFLHAKELVADGRLAICGSVNLDFRSLWEHYECGALFTGGAVVEQIAADLRAIERESREITYEEWQRRGVWKKLVEAFLCLLAPLM